MFYDLTNKFNFTWFNMNTKSILETPVVKCDAHSHIISVSQVCHRDIFAYFLAIKSFARFVSLIKVYVVDDSSLTVQDKKLIHEHIERVEIVNIRDIETGRCPIGGTWERLLFISDCNEENYVIQLDCDTLTLNQIPEVISCVRENQSFTLGTWKEQEIELMKETCANVKSSKSEHVQVLAERNFDKLPDYDQLNYVRGCSGFAGFARQSFSRSKAEEFSQQMEAIIGQRWSDWGSEQVTSNFIIANSIPSMVLPYPKYAGFRPDRNLKESAFLHFSGTYRFKNGVYRKIAKDIIKSLI